MYHLIDENEDFLVVNKQPEVSIHDEDNATDMLEKNNKGLIKQLRLDFNNSAIAPVHRLDKPTSGLLLCSKHSKAASTLSQLFQNREVEKYYLAISEIKPSKKQGLICGDMLRTRNGSWKLSKELVNPATTQFFSYSLSNINQNRGRLFILKPHTGKTHQLRVALKTIGATILGDKRYGKNKVAPNIKVAPNTKEIINNVANTDVVINEDVRPDDRMHLHAYVLRFWYKDTHYCYSVLPKGGEFSASVNEYIETNLNQPWALNWPVLSQKNKI